MKAFKRDNNEYMILALNTDDDMSVFEKNGIKVLKELLGSYKGRQELSYLVANTKEALALAAEYNQESVLILAAMENGRRTATSVQPIPFSTLYEHELGEFVNVGRINPNSEAWTFDIENGEYYVIQ